MNADRLLPYLTGATILLAFIVIVLGAYTRLSDAGLGCPDWPGCYGRMLVPAETGGIAAANNLYPDRPLEHGKAWKEMVHRYAAGALGLLILAMSVIAWKGRRQQGQPLWLPLGLLALVIFQALLGMWTVTLLLKPIIVMGHLLGGMTILLLLVWLLLTQLYKGRVGGSNRGHMFPLAAAALGIVYLQISLGGWTSANYAALVCPDLPTCQGAWWPDMDFGEAYVPWRGLGTDYEFGVLHTDARTAIHVSHRIGAVLTLLVVGTIGVAAMRDRSPRVRKTAYALLGLLLVQFSLGIANILLVVPIGVAVSHNGVAALLLACAGTLLFHARHPFPGREAS